MKQVHHIDDSAAPLANACAYLASSACQAQVADQALDMISYLCVSNRHVCVSLVVHSFCCCAYAATCAGTAQSTTLKLLMHANPDTVFLYTAYNRAVVDDARSTAPRHVDCK
jgi:hypothetical protein